MNHEQILMNKKFNEILTEEKAREWAWSLKLECKPFACPKCGSGDFYTHRSRPEVRTCRDCLRQVRLRPGTLFENSKIPLSMWFRAIYLVLYRDRPISTQELKHRLQITSYGTTWALHKKMDLALQQPGQREVFKNLFNTALLFASNLDKAS
jgi:hypothetical protein